MYGIRRLLASILAVVGVLAFVGGVVVTTARRAVYDTETIRSAADAALEDPGFRGAIEEAIVDEVARGTGPALTVVQAAVHEVVSSEGFADVLASALARAHEQFLAEDRPELTISLVDLAPLIDEQVAKLAPQRPPVDLSPLEGFASVEIPAADRLRTAEETSATVGRWGLLGGLAAMVLALLISPVRRSTLALEGGLTLLAAGLLLVAVYAGRSAAASGIEDGRREVVGGLYDAVVSATVRSLVITLVAGVIALVVAIIISLRHGDLA